MHRLLLRLVPWFTTLLLAACAGTDDAGDGARVGADGATNDAQGSAGADADAEGGDVASNVVYSDPAAPGPYPVGIATFVMPKGDGVNDVTVEVWYPAAETAATTTVYQLLGIQIPAAGYRDAKPATDAPLLLVAFSHGFGGVRWQNFTMAERLASFGYVVVAPDHPGTTVLDLGNIGQIAPLLPPRPGTLVAAADAVWQGAVAGLKPRGETYAVIGHSMGAMTVLLLGGGLISIDNYNAWCSKHKAAGGCNLVGPMDGVTPEMVAAMQPADPRIEAMVVQNTGGTFAFEDGSLKKLPHALLMTGDRDGGFYETGALAAFAAAGPGTEFVTYIDGGHNGPTDICNVPPAKAFSADCKGPAAGFADPFAIRDLSIEHTVAWLGVHFAHVPEFAAHLATPSSAYTWEVK